MTTIRKDTARDLRAEHAETMRRAADAAVIRRFGWTTDGDGNVTKACAEVRSMFSHRATTKRGATLACPA